MKLGILVLVIGMAAQAQLAVRRAPGFALPEPLQGKTHDLQDYRGKVVLIEFMKTDCPNCQGMTRSLEQVKAKYGAKVQILSVVTLPDTLPNVRNYVAEHKVTTPVLFDCGQMMASYLQITPANPQVHFPHLVVIDKSGMIRNDIESPELKGITAAIEPLLK